MNWMLAWVVYVQLSLPWVGLLGHSNRGGTLYPVSIEDDSRLIFTLKLRRMVNGFAFIQRFLPHLPRWNTHCHTVMAEPAYQIIITHILTHQWHSLWEWFGFSIQLKDILTRGVKDSTSDLPKTRQPSLSPTAASVSNLSPKHNPHQGMWQ